MKREFFVVKVCLDRRELSGVLRLARRSSFGRGAARDACKDGDFGPLLYTYGVKPEVKR